MIKVNKVIVLLLFSLFAWIIPAANSGTTKLESKPLLAGWSSIDVTPPKASMLSGQFHVRIFDHVKDPVTATALALESAGGGEQAIIVSIDALWIQDSIRDACREKLKKIIPEFDSQKLLISATHSHTAPAQLTSVFAYPELEDKNIMTPAEYSAFLTDKLTELCVKAWKNRSPGAVSWGYGHAVVGFNRRINYFNGTAEKGGNTDNPKFSHIEGYEDHSIDMLFIYNDRRKLTGMIINLACPSQVTEGGSFVSADFWHETREEIRKRLGKELFILPQCSAAGDLSPQLMLHAREQERMLRLKGLLNQKKHIAKRKEIAGRIAGAVDEVLPLASKEIYGSVPFAHTVSTLQLPVRIISDDEFKLYTEQMRLYQAELVKCKQDPKSVAYSTSYVKAGYFGSVVKRYHEQKSNPALPVESHVIRLGDVAFASNRFELFLDFGIRLKARSKAVQTFVVQLAGGGTYLATEKAEKGKSYSATAPDNLVGAEGGQVLVEEQLKIINDFFKE